MQGQTTQMIGGKLRTLKFGLDAVEIFQQTIEKSPVKTTALLARAEVYAGLVNQCMVILESPDFTYQDVCDWVDDMIGTEEGRAILKQIDDCFAESKAYKSLFATEEKKTDEQVIQ